MRAGRQAGMGGGDVDGACNGRACSVEGKGRLESEHRARATCTLNILFMSVTREVSQLEMFALKLSIL